jgi:hypothetical protein
VLHIRPATSSSLIPLALNLFADAKTLLRPMKILRTFPPLQAKKIIDSAVALAGQIPEELYAELVRHPKATGDHDARRSTDKRDLRK